MKKGHFDILKLKQGVNHYKELHRPHEVLLLLSYSFDSVCIIEYMVVCFVCCCLILYIMYSYCYVCLYCNVYVFLLLYVLLSLYLCILIVMFMSLLLCLCTLIVVYVFLLLCLCPLIVIFMYSYCYVYVFFISLFCMLRSRHCVSLTYSVYCLCVNMYSTTVTGCQPNCSYQLYHIIP